ncbi:Integral membrane protein [Bacillus cereus m1293]|nr:Integral membrane protein [Bacillus cereus m1293]
MYDLRRLYMNQNKKAILDLVFYLVIPFLIWKFAKPYIDPYYAMLLSSVPGIIYTLYTFKKEKQFNVTGFFILITLISNTTVDLLSGSAERMLWNDAYYHIVLGIIVICTIFIKNHLCYISQQILLHCKAMTVIKVVNCIVIVVSIQHCNI